MATNGGGGSEWRRLASSRGMQVVQGETENDGERENKRERGV